MTLFKNWSVTNLQKVVGLVEILFFEFIASTLIGSYYGDWKASQGAFECASKPWEFTVGDWVGLIIILAINAWILVNIARPKIKTLFYRPLLKAGPLIMSNPAIPASRYEFYSNHPSYIFIEAWNIFLISLFYLPDYTYPLVAGCPFVRTWFAGQAMLFVAVLYPVLRLFFWYVLRRRIKADKPYIIAPALVFFSLFAAIIPGFMLAATVTSHRTANALPVVNSHTFAGGAASHPELMNVPVKIQGTLLSKDLVSCPCLATQEAQCARTYAALVGLTPETDLLLILSGASEGPLLPIFKGAPDKRVEFFAELEPLPNAAKEPWKFSECGAGEFGSLSNKPKLYGKIVAP